MKIFFLVLIALLASVHGEALARRNSFVQATTAEASSIGLGGACTYQNGQGCSGSRCLNSRGAGCGKGDSSCKCK
jgi:hypothetical protein